jgi:hypothetical protein
VSVKLCAEELEEKEEMGSMDAKSLHITTGMCGDEVTDRS